VRDVDALGDRQRAVEVDRRAGQPVEERRAVAEQDRDEVDPHLVEQPGVQALAGDRAAVDADDLVAGERFGLLDRRLTAMLCRDLAWKEGYARDAHARDPLRPPRRNHRPGDLSRRPPGSPLRRLGPREPGPARR
jgi:hypothetical protein